MPGDNITMKHQPDLPDRHRGGPEVRRARGRTAPWAPVYVTKVETGLETWPRRTRAPGSVVNMAVHRLPASATTPAARTVRNDTQRLELRKYCSRCHGLTRYTERSGRPDGQVLPEGSATPGYYRPTRRECVAGVPFSSSRRPSESCGSCSLAHPGGDHGG